MKTHLAIMEIKESIEPKKAGNDIMKVDIKPVNV